jgi:cytochrome P450
VLTGWSRALAAVIDLNQEEAVRRTSRTAVEECTDYLRTVIAARRRTPGDDLISTLLHTVEAGSGPIDDAELIGTLTHLLFVGNDPVMHLIGNALMVLSAHLVERAWLAAHPEQMEAAVDELLRYDSPVQMTFRYALTDIDLHGRTLHCGDHVAVVMGSANRDPDHYPDPDRLNFSRPTGTPAHFGMGIHYCLGAPLARLEGQAALRVLLAELPDLALATGQIEWQRTVAVRGAVALPVTF